MMTEVKQREFSETVPVQYEDGFVLFMGEKIKVDPRVLIPRPETEVLVKVTANELSAPVKREYKVLDMCTGSGVVAIALCKLVLGVRMTAADISREALDVARENVEALGLSERIELMASDMFLSFVQDREDLYDAIVSNPPYVSDRDFELLDPWVKAEPVVALYAGKDGMDSINVLCSQSGKFLRKGGFLALEIGYDQSFMTERKMVENGFREIKIYKDDNGYSRVIIGWKNG